MQHTFLLQLLFCGLPVPSSCYYYVDTLLMQVNYPDGFT